MLREYFVMWGICVNFAVYSGYGPKKQLNLNTNVKYTQPTRNTHRSR